MSVFPIRKTSRAAQVTNLGLNFQPAHHFMSQLLPTSIQEGTWVWLNAFCKVQGISRPFLIFLYDYSPLYLTVFQNFLLPLVPMMGCYFKTFHDQVSLPHPLTPTHTDTIREATRHKSAYALFLTNRNSRNSLSECYTFQSFGFNKKST